MPRRQAPSPLPRGVTNTLSARVGLLAHEFRRSDLQRAPSTFLNASVERLQSEGSLLTYSGGTAPVLHRTSLLCPHGHPSDEFIYRVAYLSQTNRLCQMKNTGRTRKGYRFAPRYSTYHEKAERSLPSPPGTTHITAIHNPLLRLTESSGADGDCHHPLLYLTGVEDLGSQSTGGRFDAGQLRLADVLKAQLKPMCKRVCHWFRIPPSTSFVPIP